MSLVVLPLPRPYWFCSLISTVKAARICLAHFYPPSVGRELTRSLFTLASEYLLFSLLFSSPRSQPTLPSSQLPKPTPLLITIIVCLVLHPLALVAGIAWRRTRDREGRIRLEEEVEEAERQERAAEIEAAAANGAVPARRR